MTELNKHEIETIEQEEKHEYAEINLDEHKKHNDEFIKEVLEPYKSDNKIAEDGDEIHLSYRTLLDDGTIVDEKAETDPLVIELGAGLLLKEFEEHMVGMMEGETNKFEIEKAYGEHNPDLVESVFKESLPPQFHEVGHMITFKDNNGKYHTAKVIDIEDEKIKLDLNNPLAGQDLIFEVKVVKINKKDN